MIPCSGTIKASDINKELQRNTNASFHLDGAMERDLAEKPSGLIKFSDFACKSYGFDMIIGESHISVLFQYYGYSAPQNGFYPSDMGSINGKYPADQFPSGYSGASSSFYVYSCSTNYGNRSGKRLVMSFTSQQRTRNFIYPFGNQLTITFKFKSDNATYTYTLNRDGEGYVNENGDAIFDAMANRVGQSCMVMLTR